jgi:hypothetical protein
MEAVNRKPFQGIINIIRFNWHFYFIALLVLVSLHLSKGLLADGFHPAIAITGLLLIVSIIVSLLVSFYVYDVSDLYKLDWLQLTALPDACLVNIHAGFDETSSLLSEKYPQATLVVFDFYDPERHTEISIRRARKLYSPYPGTTEITTTNVPLQGKSADTIFCILSAHEIRNSDERTVFFLQLRNSLKKDGRIIVVEHLRDAANLFAYNIGFLHFHSKKEWQSTFAKAGLTIEKKRKITPFITAFTLQKNGTSS